MRIARDVEIRANVPIGRWAYIEPYTLVNGAEIGLFCAIGRFEYPYAYPALSAKLYRDLLSLDYDDSAPPVRIGSDVWVGEKAIVLGGGQSRRDRRSRRRGHQGCPALCDRSGRPRADH